MAFSWPMFSHLQTAISSLQLCEKQLEQNQNISQAHLMSAYYEIGQAIQEWHRQEQTRAWERTSSKLEVKKT
ncbi:MAG: hypothetical protein ACOC43_03250 [Desulfohalobiaceae bacterium]